MNYKQVIPKTDRCASRYGWIVIALGVIMLFTALVLIAEEAKLDRVRSSPPSMASNKNSELASTSSPSKLTTIVNTRYGFSFDTLGFFVGEDSGLESASGGGLATARLYVIGDVYASQPILRISILDPGVVAQRKPQLADRWSQAAFVQALDLQNDLGSTSTIASVTIGGKPGVQFYSNESTRHIFLELKNGLVMSIASYPRHGMTLDQIIETITFSD